MSIIMVHADLPQALCASSLPEGAKDILRSFVPGKGVSLFIACCLRGRPWTGKKRLPPGGDSLD